MTAGIDQMNGPLRITGQNLWPRRPSDHFRQAVTTANHISVFVICDDLRSDQVLDRSRAPAFARRKKADHHIPSSRLPIFNSSDIRRSIATSAAIMALASNC
ncbi:hypothetical protein DFP92_107190 [Yoonia sediminilitoris]|uniref:Uncharacterized protein n=1 Tax=Yoonia sediminilitoris TaxID=1286148 RepID=A0A2T6KF29_9RHOB|nr:hypothetical protein C8N45_107190 [Yoonia sediminilitoris]RCW94899.1 hypothetical protein DFP92_107190 [Yoonia sediminilitoris]